jgi:hypothetical protein
MLEELQRRTDTKTTARDYLQAVARFAAYFRTRPDQLSRLFHDATQDEEGMDRTVESPQADRYTGATSPRTDRPRPAAGR